MMESNPSAESVLVTLAVGVVIALLGWAAKSLSSLLTEMRTVSHTVFGPPGERRLGLVAEVERINGVQHRHNGWLTAVGYELDLQMNKDGSVDRIAVAERRSTLRRAEDAANLPPRRGDDA